MPRLSSGRMVMLSATSLLDKIKFGSDESVSAVIVAYRLSVSTPRDLVGYLTVGYFRDGDEPTEGNAYDSGFTVNAVMQGRAGWSEDEIRELETWIKNEPRIEAWLSEQFEEINAAIRDSVVWSVPLWTDDETTKPDQ